ncbi:glycoside hydrolase family 20 zincin-like fold domain-containing protein [Dyadobacter jiangsuensis]|uniref:beta-N-acetylhexosaminidase n=1 Tax=Dyadobacter jiangsuensis TaxID=1591085 RepID=A0A2P8FXT1_9BACT|nr:glycoside hydrolase family 20 zincin-like fold domain-containing protein [Dyadobacter jiangsuensis]PSL26530.1 glycosyl hydrolase family 20 [Dyadobacter jiangsuensis]
MLLRLLAACLFVTSVLAQNTPVLLPQPQMVRYSEEKFPVSLLTVAMPPAASAEVRFALQELKSIVGERTGTGIKNASSSASATFQWVIRREGGALPEVSERDGKSTREHYKLTVSNKGVRVEAQTSAGLYYAVQTLRQLISGEGKTAFIPGVVVEDRPALTYRGVMMDFAHGGLPTIAEIKRQIDFLARWKTNQYYFYNEVSIELKGFPNIAYRSGYTQAQVREIIAYGRQRHMDVVPFLNLYGHLHELLRNEQYAGLAIGQYGHELDPRKSATNALLKDWISQYAELFPGPFIHVGFDETWETKRIADDKDARINSEDLWVQQLTFVQAELKKYGKTVLAWTDMNNYYPDIIQKIPAEVIPVLWEYKPDTVEINRYLRPILKEQKPFFIQPAVSGWGHIYPDADYTYDNIDLCLQAGVKHKALGFIHSVWTDPVEPFVRASWLFMAYGCIGAWQGNVPDKKHFTETYSHVMYRLVAGPMQKAFDDLAAANEALDKCLGRNTNGMPRGTIIESWSNPFLPYYLKNTLEHAADFRNARRLSESAQAELITALATCSPGDTAFIHSMIVTARLMRYSATRFLWAKTICDRWNESMLERKKNDFVAYDLVYPCHGLLVDVMDEAGELKTAYSEAWRSEYIPYRLNTMLGRFDVENGLWEKLSLKVIDYRVESKPDHVADQSFEVLFKPDF